MDHKIHADERFPTVSAATSSEPRSPTRLLLFAWVALAFLAYMWQFRGMFDAAFRIFGRR